MHHCRLVAVGHGLGCSQFPSYQRQRCARSLSTIKCCPRTFSLSIRRRTRTSSPVFCAKRLGPGDSKRVITVAATVAAMTSLVLLAGWVVAGLAVAGAIALALFLSPELRSYPTTWMEKHLFPDANQITPQQMAKNRDQAKVYRVLAFGDSLTEGFTQGGVAFHPYAKQLGDLLYPQLPQGWHLEIEEQGESGERVLFGMKDRLQRTLDEHTTANRLYDWVLLLGGINDLAGDDSSAEEVMAGLDALVQKCLDHGSNVMLMTLMEVAHPMLSVEKQRQQLNQIITDYVQQRQWDKQGLAGSSLKPGQQLNGTAGPAAAAEPTNGTASDPRAARRLKPQVYLFDLASAFPYDNLDDEQKFDLWDDGVHLTMVGYEHMGKLITEALIPLVQQEVSRIGAATAEGAAVVNGDHGDSKKLN